MLESMYSISSQDGAAFKLNQKKREGCEFSIHHSLVCCCLLMNEYRD